MIEGKLVQIKSEYFNWQEFRSLLERNPYLKELLTPVEKGGKGYYLITQHLKAYEKICFYAVENNGRIYYLVAQLLKTDERICFYVDEEIIERLLNGEIDKLPTKQRKNVMILPKIEKQPITTYTTTKKLALSKWGLVAVICFLVGLGIGTGAIWSYNTRSAVEKSVKQKILSPETSEFHIYEVVIQGINGLPVPVVNETYIIKPRQTTIVTVTVDSKYYANQNFKIEYWAAEGKIGSDGTYIAPDLPGKKDMITIKMLNKDTGEMLDWKIIKIKLLT